MPISRLGIVRDRANIASPLTDDDLTSLVADTELKVIQAGQPIDLATWKQIDDQVLAGRPDLKIRVYGFYFEQCDLSFVAQMCHVRHFIADCLQTATGLEAIPTLTGLQSLSIGIHDLESFDFLNELDTSQLQDLSLQATRSKKPSLRILSRCPGLTKLYLEGQAKDIETISELSELQDLTLRSITVPALDFLSGLRHLWSLDIKLGGTKNLKALPQIPGIKYLELWQIKGLSNLSPISEMFDLQFLFLQALRQVQHLPDLSRLKALRRVHIDTMRGLKDISALTTAPALEELVHVDPNSLEPAQYAELINKGVLKRLSARFRNRTKAAEMAEMMQQGGVEPYEYYHPFEYRESAGR